MGNTQQGLFVKALFCILILICSFSTQAKKRTKKRISFKRIGEIVQKKDPSYEINLDRAEPRVKLTRSCKSDSLPTLVQNNSHFSNCIDTSSPATSERQREEGFLLQIQ